MIGGLVMQESNIETGLEKTGVIKLSFIQTLRSFGPGIIVVLTALGAGDLVDSSVAGSHYGYDLMWVLALATLVRFVIVNIMARFDLCNTERITLFEGYSRLHKVYPYFFMIFSLLLGNLVTAVMVKGTGEALTNLFNFGNPLMWSVIAVASSFFVTGKSVYNKLENVMKALLAIMTLSFFGLAIYAGPDVVGIAKGTIGFGMPEGTGIFGTLMLAMSLVGAVAGSLTNFLYPHFIRDKGWTTPAHKRMQRNDLLFGMVMLILINLSIWIVGAEILRPNNIEVKELSDISKALGIYIGSFGPVIFYLGVFGVLYSTILGTSVGFSKIAVENLHIIKKERAEKYGKVLTEDPIYSKFALFLLISSLVWTLPGMPGFVVLTIVANMFNAVALPSIAIGLLILSNRKKLLGKHTNNLFENLLLIATTGLAIYGAIKIVIGLF
jgi:Mn2+/Fe2+ NRAMP family transporter